MALAADAPLPKGQFQYLESTINKVKSLWLIIIIIIIIIITQTHIYKCKSGNSWHMFNCKKFPKLHIRPPSLILLMKYPRVGEYFPAKAEK
jgi:hypothetical protein